MRSSTARTGADRASRISLRRRSATAREPATDGTPDGTSFLGDLNPLPQSSDPQVLTPFNGKIIFTATDDLHGRQILISGGTPAITHMVTVIPPTAYFIDHFYVVGAMAYFVADQDQRQLWRTDGTASGTFPLVTMPK